MYAYTYIHHVYTYVCIIHVCMFMKRNNLILLLLFLSYRRYLVSCVSKQVGQNDKLIDVLPVRD